jgi:hypothetical protein
LRSERWQVGIPRSPTRSFWWGFDAVDLPTEYIALRGASLWRMDQALARAGG